MADGTQFTDIFLEVVKPILARHPALSHALVINEKRPRVELIIHKQDERGFDVGVVCEKHGIYPWADNWRSSPWDMATPHSPMHLQQTCENVMGFVRTLLCPDARLRVQEKAGKPCHWILELKDGDDWKPQDDTSIVLFNFLGKITESIRQNRHFPAREMTRFQVDQLWHASWAD
ncbi:MAG: hypothetical protein HY301_05900 [Verrucomicrobia bacterium]|nr:hypothetical protein [Verrucomicrobiota bacterium]